MRIQALGADRKKIIGFRLQLPESPARGIVAQLLIDGDPHAPVVRIIEAEFVERQLQAHAARLDIGFLERPVLEETILLPMRRRVREFAGFQRREEAIRHADRHFARAGILDIHAQGPAHGHAEHDHAVGMREIEGQAHVLGLRIQRMRSAVGVGAEHPIPRVDRHVARQHRSHQNARHQVATTIPREIVFRLLRAFVRTEQLPIREMQGLVGDRFVIHQPQMDLGRVDRDRQAHAITGADIDTSIASTLMDGEQGFRCDHRLGRITERIVDIGHAVDLHAAIEMAVPVHMDAGIDFPQLRFQPLGTEDGVQQPGRGRDVPRHHIDTRQEVRTGDHRFVARIGRRRVERVEMQRDFVGAIAIGPAAGAEIHPHRLQFLGRLAEGIIVPAQQRMNRHAALAVRPHRDPARFGHRADFGEFLQGTLVAAFARHPQIVIAGYEHHFAETFGECAQTPLEQRGLVGQIAGEDQQVVPIIENREVFDPLGVGVVIDVDIGKREDSHAMGSALPGRRKPGAARIARASRPRLREILARGIKRSIEARGIEAQRHERNPEE